MKLSRLASTTVRNHTSPRPSTLAKRFETASKNAPGVESDLPVLLYQTSSVSDEAARHGELTLSVHGRDFTSCRKFDEPVDPVVEKIIISDEQRSDSCLN